MNLSEYFENTKGTGVLATADEDGNVDVALYARPHVMDEDTVAFIMNERLSYHNITSNPKAAYLFQEDSPGHKGKRLYLKKTVEDDDEELIDSIRRKTKMHHAGDSKKHLVYFKVEKIRELTGE
ncbi:MAG: pyridoxamine 5'-phosphate oxidase family protein [Phycisphaerae bacterium]|nr:pyridoxamine 5'-phosphate oxidase family protein [Phycisphaerae bacterium]